jgi:M6 family metalloprotease-like protein
MKFSLTRTFLIIFFFSLMWHLNSSAVSLSDEVVEKLRKEGKLEEWLKMANLARANGVWQPNPNPPLVGAGKGIPAVAESLRAIVLLVDFDDKVYVKDTSQFSSTLFTKGTFPTGSMRDFYWENSYHQFDLNGAVYGWIRAPQSYSYYVDGQWGVYGSYPYNARRLVEDAVNEANTYVNFANFDTNHDGWVDALFVVHAGPGAEETGSPNDIWSHEWTTTYVMNVDGVKISNYAMCPEKEANGDLAHIGVFCHEFGHVLGLIDLYDTDAYNPSEGLGHWSTMASGSWTNNGITPAHFDAWSKSKLGWIEIDTIISNLTDVPILQIETSPKAYRIWTNGGTGSQYFLVENRQKTKFDSHLDGEGLLIYHVDESISTNDHEWCPGDPASQHFKVALKQADGHFDLEGCYGTLNRGDGGDPFPGNLGKRAFDDTTIPSSRNYYNNSTQVAVWNISNSDSVMYANLDVTWSRPNLALEDFFFNDSTDGNGNGRAEPGETVKLCFILSNTWASLSDAWVIASADTEGISFSIDSVYLGNIGSPDTVDNFSHPLQFSVALGFPSQKVDFTLHICGNGGSYCTDRTQEMNMGSPEILLVDDDDQLTGDSNYFAFFQQALDSLGAVYDVWDRKAELKSSVNLSSYPILIWFTGNHRDSVFSTQDVADLKNYLDGSGKLFLTSQDVVEALFSSSDPMDTLFLRNYLHVRWGGNCSISLLKGNTGDLIGDNLWIVLGGYGVPLNQISKDNLIPDPEAEKVLIYAAAGWAPTDSTAGIRFQNDTFKVVVFGFGFEGINSTSPLYYGKTGTKPVVVMQKVLNWLRGSSDVFDGEEEFVSLPKTIELHQNFPNPFNPVTSIRYSVGSGQRKAADGGVVSSEVEGQKTMDNSPSHLTLKIYNILGQKVRTLVDEPISAGNYEVIWDGRDQNGKEVSSGIYFYQLKAKEYSETKKMILLK